MRPSSWLVAVALLLALAPLAYSKGEPKKNAAAGAERADTGLPSGVSRGRPRGLDPEKDAADDARVASAAAADPPTPEGGTRKLMKLKNARTMAKELRAAGEISYKNDDSSIENDYCLIENDDSSIENDDSSIDDDSSSTENDDL